MITALLLSYNRTNFIEQALESVGQQNGSNWNLILSDCSDDATAAAKIQQIFERFKSKHPANTCQLLRHPNRMRQATHLSAALNAVESPYVALLDDDDYWAPNHLQRATEWLEQDQLNGLTLSNGQIVDGANNLKGFTNSPTLEIPHESKPKDWLYWLLRTYYGSTSGFVFRKAALADWTYPNFPCIDLHIAVGILVNGYQCKGFSAPSYYYREHEQSNYTKGDQVLRERHQWRIWLARNHGIQLTRKCLKFPLLVLKSALPRNLKFSK